MKYMTMIFVLYLALSAQTVAGDYNYLELGAGYKINGSAWAGDVPAIAEVGRHFNIQDNLYIRAGINHTSNLDRGAPFNNEAESTLNWMYVKFGLRF